MALACTRCDEVPAAGAAAGSRCASCGALLVERTTAPMATTSALDAANAPAPAFELPDTLSLEPEPERAAPGAASFAPPPDGASPTLTLGEAAAPGEAAPYVPSIALDVDREWAAEKARKQHAPPATHGTMFEKKRRPLVSPFVYLFLLLAGAGGAAYWYLVLRPQAAESPAPEASPPLSRGQPTRPADVKAGVSIKIIGPAGTPVTIDGKPAGKVPITLQRTASDRPLVIGGPRGMKKTVVPDRDRTVDLSRP